VKRRKCQWTLREGVCTICCTCVVFCPVFRNFLCILIKANGCKARNGAVSSVELVFALCHHYLY